MKSTIYEQNKRYIVIACVFLLILILFNNLGILHFLQNFFTKFLLPLKETTYVLANKIRAATGFANYQQLTKNNEALRAELNNYLIDYSRLHILETENRELRDLIKLNKSSPKHIIAQVIGTDNLNNRSILIINKGNKDGIRIDLPVIIPNHDTYNPDAQGIMIGKIAKVGHDFSEIRSLFHPLSKTAALILTKDNNQVHGLTSGDLKLGIIIDLIPKNQKISLDDIIITSGLENNIIKGLVIGRIQHITTNPKDVWESALIKVPYNINDIAFVDVILP